MTAERPAGRVRHIMLNVGTGVVFLVIVVLLLMWLAGAFHRKIDDASAAAAEEIAVGRPIGDAVLVPVRRISVPRIEPAVGTIRAVHETSVASKLLAKVVELNVKAGQQVAKEEVLARLDDADLVARLEQAKANLVGATARRDQAQIEHDRVQRLIEQRAAAEIEMDRVRAALKSAEAQFDQAGQAVSEARTLLDYATIRSPIDGIVIDKKVEIGDTSTPGQVLVTLYDPTRMQLVASVRESLTQRLSVGQAIRVRIDALDKTCEGRISEIVPEAESASRTFSVKVTGPCPPGMYSGMFGRLLIPLQDETILVIPQAAVRRVGQLNLVDVGDGDLLRRRAVQLGRTIEDDVEILSGLREGERVALPIPADSNG